MNNLAAILGSRRRLPMLDGLRAVAITLVMLMHFGVRVSGGLGVNLFFTLSGFLITWLLLAELAQSSTIDFKGFYLRRTFRISSFSVHCRILKEIIGGRGMSGRWRRTRWIGMYPFMIKFM
jgi:peptidoglycan/LPS O-acetylase OafA/YrhL